MTGRESREEVKSSTRGGSALRSKTTFTILMTVVLMASTVTLGYAGGGGAGGGPGTILLQCYEAAAGPNAPQILTVDDQFIDPTTEKIGKLKMICSFNPSATPTANSPDGFHPVTAFDSFTCYEAPGANSKSTVSYTDNLFASPQSAKVGTSQVLCVAACSNPSGCTGP
jgi:hypothetical protein